MKSKKHLILLYHLHRVSVCSTATGSFISMQVMPMPAVEMDLVVMSCFMCRTIHGFDIIAHEGDAMRMPTRVFTEDDTVINPHRPHCMTPRGTRRAVRHHPMFYGYKRLKVMVMDCTEAKFKAKKTVKINAKLCNKMSYVPVPHKILVLNNPFGEKPSVKAVSCETWDARWTVRGPAEGRQLSPWGLVFSPGHNSLFVGDYCRVVVLSPSDGSVRQIIGFSGMGMIQGLSLHNNNKQLVVLDVNHESNFRISFWDLY